MPPRFNLFTARKGIPMLRQPTTQKTPLNLAIRPAGLAARHSSSNSKTSTTPQPPSDADETPKGPTQDPLPHVSEEKAQMDKIMSGKSCTGGAAAPTSPELEQGTPVSEILQRDEEAQKHMPKVMQDQIGKSKPSGSGGNNPSGTRGFATSARVGQDMQQQQQPPQQPPQQGGGAGEGADPSAALVANMISNITESAENLHGLKFGKPEALPRSENHRARYDLVLAKFTNMIMRHGKKAQAQRNMSIILDYLRTSPPPTPSPRRRLLPGGPPPAQLPLNPVQYLNVVVSSLEPLIGVRNARGVAGGGRMLPVPWPLGPNSRRRAAMQWILAAADKRRDPVFANRVAQEIVAVAEGRSSAWERREMVHKNGTAARANPEQVEQKKKVAAAMRRR